MQKDEFKGLFGFTVKINNKAEPTHEDYLPIFKSMSRYVEIIDFTYEDKKKDKKTKTKLHVHGMLKCVRHPYFESVIPKGSGIKIYVERIYDMKGWQKYCLKNVAPKDFLQIAEPINDSPKIDNRVYMFENSQ